MTAKVGCTGLKSRELIQYTAQPGRMRMVIILVSHMDHHGKNSPGCLIQREQAGIINIKMLTVRMNLDAFKSHFPEAAHIIADVIQCSMDRSKSDKAAVLLSLIQNKSVNGINMFRFYCHRKDHIPGYAGSGTPFHKGAHGPIHILTKLIIIADTPGRFQRDGLRIYMGMDINHIHFRYASVFAIVSYIIVLTVKIASFFFLSFHIKTDNLNYEQIVTIWGRP